MPNIGKMTASYLESVNENKRGGHERGVVKHERGVVNMRVELAVIEGGGEVRRKGRGRREGTSDGQRVHLASQTLQHSTGLRVT